jgi:hypothetical protein
LLCDLQLRRNRDSVSQALFQKTQVKGMYGCKVSQLLMGVLSHKSTPTVSF